LQLAAISFDPSQALEMLMVLFQWYTSPEINPVGRKKPVSLIDQFDNYGTSYRSIGNIQTEYKMHFLSELKAVANFGYDQLSGRSYGGTGANFLNGIKVQDTIIRMKIQVQDLIK
jgi:iron complex outermembrane receptor protein